MKFKGNGRKHAGVLHIKAMTVSQRPTFLDYVQAGAEINFICGIDFTASNKDPRDPESLHYLSQTGVLLGLCWAWDNSAGKGKGAAMLDANACACICLASARFQFGRCRGQRIALNSTLSTGRAVDGLGDFGLQDAMTAQPTHAHGIHTPPHPATLLAHTRWQHALRGCHLRCGKCAAGVRQGQPVPMLRLWLQAPGQHSGSLRTLGSRWQPDGAGYPGHCAGLQVCGAGTLLQLGTAYKTHALLTHDTVLFMSSSSDIDSCRTAAAGYVDERAWACICAGCDARVLHPMLHPVRRNALYTRALSGPTLFGPLLKQAAATAFTTSGFRYTVCLILTDGCIHDMQVCFLHAPMTHATGGCWLPCFTANGQHPVLRPHHFISAGAHLAPGGQGLYPALTSDRAIWLTVFCCSPHRLCYRIP